MTDARNNKWNSTAVSWFRPERSQNIWPHSYADNRVAVRGYVSTRLVREGQHQSNVAGACKPQTDALLLQYRALLSLMRWLIAYCDSLHANPNFYFLIGCLAPGLQFLKILEALGQTINVHLESLFFSQFDHYR